MSIRIIFILLSISSFVYSKYEWKFVAGDVAINRKGIFTLDPPTYTALSPGARYGHSMWIDAEKNDIYIFGGKGLSIGISEVYLNDFWRYKIDTKEWTFIGIEGQHTNGLGKYDTSANAFPMNRYGAASWFDSVNRKLWLFGGEGKKSASEGVINDLWSYAIDDDIWKWEGGEPSREIGIYTGDSKMPGSRRHMSYWIDETEGKLYLSGGYGVTDDSSDTGGIYDIWSYTIESGKWDVLVYSTELRSKYVITEDPGSRYDHTSWYDPETNKVYQFGGYGFGETANGYMNDLWSFDLALKEWEVLTEKESIGPYKDPNYDDDITPGSRSKGVSFYEQAEKKIYLFSGEQKSSESLNSLWYFDLNTNEWNFVSGDKHKNALGKIQCFNDESRPGSRSDASIAQMGDQVIIFGGKGYDYRDKGFLSDMWSLNLKEIPTSPDDGDTGSGGDGDDMSNDDEDGSTEDEVTSSSLSKYNLLLAVVSMVILSILF